MRLHRPVLAGVALAALLPVTAASAATGVTAAGSALSSATLAAVSVGAISGVVDAQTLAIGALTASAETTSTAAPAVTFVPLTLNGAKTGAVTVTPANSPKTVAAVTTAALPLNILSATSPSATLTAAKTTAGPSAVLKSSLGQIKLLGLPVALDGTVDVGSLTDGSHAQAGKKLAISNVALPNLADLLAALGLDLAKLPAETLNALVETLPVDIDAATQNLVDDANDAVDAAQQAVDAKQVEIDAALADVAAKAAALDAALVGVPLPAPFAGVSEPLDHNDWDALGATPAGQAIQDTIVTANSGVATPAGEYETAKATLDTLQGQLTTLRGTLLGAIADLASLVDGVLGATSLASIGAAEVSTKASVGAAKTAAVTGYVSDVKVLGLDVIDAVTGESAIDLVKVVGDAAGELNAVLEDLATALSTALSSATGATGLVIPAPSITLLTKQMSTGTDGAFGTADATVTTLSVSLGSATIPRIYALDGAGSLPGVATVSNGFKTAPLSINVGVLAESARFRPASATGTPGSGPSHPATGGPEGLAVVAVIGTALALGVRRFRTQ